MFELIPEKTWLGLDKLAQKKIANSLFGALVEVAKKMNLYEVFLVSCNHTDPEDIMDRLQFAGKRMAETYPDLAITPDLLELCVSRGIGALGEVGTESRCYMLRPWTFEDACQESLIPHLDQNASAERQETLNFLFERIANLLHEYLMHTDATDPDGVLRTTLKESVYELTIYKAVSDDPVDGELVFNRWFVRTEKEYEKWKAANS